MHQNSWHEKDTDSESDEQGGSNSPAAGRWGTLTVEKEEEDRGVSNEEFIRLQDELMALRLHQEELLAENRRLASSANSAAVSAQQVPGLPALPSASAFRKQFSSHFQASTSAMSAFGARGVTSLSTTFSKMADPTEAKAASAANAFGDELDAQDREALKAEAEYLKTRTKATLEEAAEFRSVANDAQQVLDEIERAKQLPAELPSLQELHAHFGSTAEDPLPDEFLLCVAEAALGLTSRMDAHGSDVEEPEEDEEAKMLRHKVEANNEELSRMLAHFNKQQETIKGLQEEVYSGDASSKKKEAKQQLKDRLKEVERQVEELSQQLSASEQGAAQFQKQRALLRQAALEANQRDEIYVEMKSLFEIQQAELASLRDRLNLTLEDLAARQCRSALSLNSLDAAASPSSSSHQLRGLARSSSSSSTAASPSRKLRSASQDVSKTKDVQLQADLDEERSLHGLRERAMLEAELEDLRVAKVLLEKRTARELQELRSFFPPARQPPQAKAGSSKVAASATTAAAAASAATTTSAAAPSQGAEEVPSGCASGGSGAAVSGLKSDPQAFNICSDGEEDNDDDDARRLRLLEFELPVDELELPGDAQLQPEYSEEQIVLQQISELEQRTGFLQQEVSALYEAERSLKTENKEKNELVAYLLERVDVQRRPQASRRAGSTATSGDGSRRFGDAVSSSTSSQRQAPEKGSEEDISELECIVEEVQQDNLRLRNDIKIMSDEFRKVLTRTKVGTDPARRS